MYYGFLDKELRVRGGLTRLCSTRVLSAGMRGRQEGFGKEGAVWQGLVCTIQEKEEGSEGFLPAELSFSHGRDGNY